MTLTLLSQATLFPLQNNFKTRAAIPSSLLRLAGTYRHPKASKTKTPNT